MDLKGGVGSTAPLAGGPPSSLIFQEMTGGEGVLLVSAPPFPFWGRAVTMWVALTYGGYGDSKTSHQGRYQLTWI